VLRDNTADRVFYDGSINNAKEFLAFVKSPSNLFYFVMEENHMCGFVWLNHLECDTARIHFCGFKRKWGHIIQIGKWVLNQLIHMQNEFGFYLFDTFVGYTPANNRLAVKYNQNIGMVTVGVIPGLLLDYHNGRAVDGVVTYFNRQEASKSEDLYKG